MISTNNKINFLDGFKISVSEIPKYNHFACNFVEKLDLPLMKIIYDSDELKDKPEIRSQLKNVIDKTNVNDTLKVKHYQAKKCGRFYAESNISMIPLSKHVKQTIFHYLGWLDIDMVKGHPSIAIEVAKTVDVALPTFEKYVNEFDDIVNTLSEFYSADVNNPLTKDNVKWLFNSLIYGGGFESWVTGVTEGDETYEPKTLKNTSRIHPLVSNFKSECIFVADKIFKENPSLVKKVADQKTELYQKKNTTASYWFQIIENHIVYLVADFLLQRGIIRSGEFGCEYDGLNLPPCNIPDKELLVNEINDLVKMNTGLDIKFKFKQYDENYILHSCIETRKNLAIIQDEIKVEKVPKNVGVTSDLEAAQKLYSLYPHWKYCLGALYVFDDLEGLWTDNSIVQIKIFNRYTDELYLLIPGKDSNMLKTNKSYGSNTSYQKQMIDQLKAQCIDNHWIRRSQSSSLHYLLFNNGYFDLQNEKFYNKATYGFNPDIVFTGKIPHDFEIIDKPYMKDIERRFFHNPLGEEVGNYLIYILARALGGDILKNVVFGLGDTNCGKSVLTAAIMQSCGDYVGSFNAENLVYNRSSNDEAQKMRWALLLAKKRIIFSNEMKNTVEINGNMLKKISSGGDTLIGRTHGGTETEFVTHFLPVCFANDIPKIKPYDAAVDDRLRIISFNKQFVENPENEFELQKDENIYNEIKTIEFQKAFVGLLVYNYWHYHQQKANGDEPRIPLEVINAKKEWITEDQNNVLTMFLNDYIITNEEKDYIKSNELKSWLDEKKVGISMEKFSKDLKKYSVLHHFDMVNNKLKKIEGKACRVWVGIKDVRYSPECVIENDNDNEEYIFEEI